MKKNFYRKLTLKQIKNTVTSSVNILKNKFQLTEKEKKKERRERSNRINKLQRERIFIK